jgi:hydrogenase maturation protease
MEMLEPESEFAADVEFVDGGAADLELLPYLAQRRSILVLDAVTQGAPPGTVHVLEGAALEAFRARRNATIADGDALELLMSAQMRGEAAKRVVVLGIEPGSVATGIGLSEAVEESLDFAASRARAVLQSMLRD